SASRAKVTAIFTAPRGAGRSPLSSTSPSTVFWPKVLDSPWLMRILTLDWLSIAVANSRVRSQGTAVFRTIIGSQKPPTVSTANVSGVTSTSSGAANTGATSSGAGKTGGAGSGASSTGAACIGAVVTARGATKGGGAGGGNTAGGGSGG